MTTSMENDDLVSQEAAFWLVALREDSADHELKKRFEAWLAADQENAWAWADTVAVYDMLGELRPPAEAHKASVLALPAWLSQRVGLAIAGAAMAACLAVAILGDVVLRAQADFVTATAELRSLRLEDGSVVHLGPNSAIDVAVFAGERRLDLLRGEAFFEISHDPQRPFRVIADGVEISVLGTAFDVRLEDAVTAVSVREGRVRVIHGPGRAPLPEPLGRGDWVRVARDGKTTRGNLPSDEIAPWLQGQIVARDRPMGEVVGELRRYFNGAIVVMDDNFVRQHVTGVYNLSDPVAALRAVAGAHGGSVRQLSPWLLLVSGS